MRSCDRQEEGGRDSIVPRTERRRSTSAGEGMTPAWTPEKISRQVLKSFWTKVGIAGEFFCRLRFLFSDGPLTLLRRRQLPRFPVRKVALHPHERIKDKSGDGLAEERWRGSDLTPLMDTEEDDDGG